MSGTRTYATPKLTVNLGPLTTTYTPPPECTQLTLAVMGNLMMSKPPKSYYELLYGYNCTKDFEQTRPVVREACYPSQYAQAYNKMGSPFEENNRIFPVYSPASICPYGYAKKCTMVHSQDKKSISDATAWNNLAQGDVAYGCCPIGYLCAAQPYTCVSYIKNTVFTADMDPECDNAYTNTQTRDIDIITVDDTVVVSVIAPQVVLVSPKQTSTTPPSHNSQAPLSRPSDSPHGLSRGAKIGIGVAISIVCILLLIIGVVYYRRRVKKLTSKTSFENDPFGKPELDASGSSNFTTASLEKGKSELDGTVSHSRNVSGASSELDGRTLQYSELSGDSRTTSQAFELAGDSSPPNHNAALSPMVEPVSQFKIARRPVSSVSGLSNSSTCGAYATTALTSLDEYGSEPESDTASRDVTRKRKT